jgi:hypothetical protein
LRKTTARLIGFYGTPKGEKQMSTTATDHSESKPETQTKAAKQSAHVVDKFAEARLAKKKQRRRAHRATIRRSNTGG